MSRSLPTKIYKRRSPHFLSIPVLVLGILACIFIIRAGLRSMGHPNPAIALVASGRYFLVGFGGIIACLTGFYWIVFGWIRDLPELIISSEGITYRTVWRVRKYCWASLNRFEKLPYGRSDLIRSRISSLSGKEKAKKEILGISLQWIDAKPDHLLRELNEYRSFLCDGKETGSL